MSDETNWSFPAELQPRQDKVAFDLARALDAMVLLRAEIPEDAFTASVLGTERAGYGIVIRDDGLVLTIGYLITEAESIWLSTNDGRAVPAHPLAYDQATGFGLVMPLGRLNLPALPRGSARSISTGTDVYVLGHGGRAHALRARVLVKREFAGYWEYVLDEAIFTAPPHPQWGGAALVNVAGELVGVGSLLVQESADGSEVEGNMFVPIDLLEPILDDMVRLGRPTRPRRPWLGMYTSEVQGHLVVSGLAQGGPADRAGVALGDVVLEVGGERVSGLADLFRKIWRRGPAGTEIPLSIAHKGDFKRLRVISADRDDFLKKPRMH